MQVFVAFAIKDFDRVRRGLEAHYGGGNHYNAGRGTWFIATDGETTRQVATKIGVGDSQDSTGGIVVSVTSYWGRHSTDLWEWIDLKLKTNAR